MASSAVPSSGDRGVCAAVALGWQVAQLFHSPVHRGPVSNPPRSEQLPGRSHFPGATLSKWLGEQIQSQLTTLLPAPPPAVLEAMAEVLTALADPDRSRGTTLDAIFTLHCRLLEALTITDYRLGKGYGLGRAMGETALLPAGATAGEERKQKFKSMFADGRAIAIRDWLADLKTLLPDHTAYATSRSLHDWQQWAKGDRTLREWAGARSAIEVQGRIWRELLTGEKAARDILKLADYHAAGRRVAKRVITRFWWVIALAMLLTAGIIFAGLYLHGIPPSLRLVGGIAWLAGALGISVKGIGVLLGTGFKEVEGWLWNVELDGSIAVAATYLPPGMKASRVSGGSLGELSPKPKTAAQPQQAAMLRQTPSEAAD